MFKPKVALKRKTTVLLIACLLLAGPAVAVAPALSSGYMPKVVQFSVTDRGANAFTSSTHGYRSRPIRAGKRFNLVGLSWVGASEPLLFLRTRLEGKRWSRWVNVSTDKDHNPDRASAERRAKRNASDPAWVGEADEVQYRVAGRFRVGSVRLHFVNTKGTATGADRLRSRLRGIASGFTSTVALLFSVNSTEAEGGQPTIIPRAEWGASQCRSKRISYGSVKHAVIHHTVSSNSYGPDESKSIVLAICRYHRNTRGWNDIGYNFLIDRFGRIFEGRDGGVDRAVIGAHASGYNSVSFGVGNIGTFSSSGQTGGSMDALARLVAWKLAIHGSPVLGKATVSTGGTSSRQPSARQASLNIVIGHRDVNSTECPGGALYRQLPRLRDLADAKQRGINTSPYTLSASSAPQPILFGSRATLFGNLKETSTGQVLAQQNVRLDVSSRGRWRRFRTVATDQAGDWTTTVVPSRKRSYRAVYTAADGSGAVISSRVTVKVQPRIGLRLVGGRNTGDGYSFRLGRLALLSATIDPKRRKLVLVVYRRSRGKYGRFMRKELRKRRRGSHRAYFRFNRRGTYRIRVYYRGDRQLAKAFAERPGINVR